MTDIGLLHLDYLVITRVVLRLVGVFGVIVYVQPVKGIVILCRKINNKCYETFIAWAINMKRRSRCNATLGRCAERMYFEQIV